MRCASQRRAVWNNLQLYRLSNVDGRAGRRKDHDEGVQSVKLGSSSNSKKKNIFFFEFELEPTHANMMAPTSHTQEREEDINHSLDVGKMISVPHFGLVGAFFVTGETAKCRLQRRI